MFLESDTNPQKRFQLKSVIKSVLENRSAFMLKSKANILSFWKQDFRLFCRFLSEEVETYAWESKCILKIRLYQKFVSRSISLYGFEATLR